MTQRLCAPKSLCIDKFGTMNRNRSALVIYPYKKKYLCFKKKVTKTAAAINPFLFEPEAIYGPRFPLRPYAATAPWILRCVRPLRQSLGPSPHDQERFKRATLKKEPLGNPRGRKRCLLPTKKRGFLTQKGYILKVVKCFTLPMAMCFPQRDLF